MEGERYAAFAHSRSVPRVSHRPRARCARTSQRLPEVKMPRIRPSGSRHAPSIVRLRGVFRDCRCRRRHWRSRRAAASTSRFDGDWLVTMTCPDNTEKSAARGYKRQFPAQVKDGVLQRRDRRRRVGRLAAHRRPDRRRRQRPPRRARPHRRPRLRGRSIRRRRRPTRSTSTPASTARAAAAGASSSASATSPSSAAERRQDTTW